jgi:hypothetical protein
MHYFEFIKKPSNIPGLSFIPSFENEEENAKDNFGSTFEYSIPKEVSDRSYDLVYQKIKEMGEDCNSILEIGIHQNIKSFTLALTSAKRESCKYLGVDIDDKRYLSEPSSNVFAIQADSISQREIRTYLHNTLRVKKLSVLFIDGNHSVNYALNDFLYSDLLHKGGLVFLHDINVHPGPNLLYHCIDENVFSKESYFDETDDYGLAILKKNHD